MSALMRLRFMGGKSVLPWGEKLQDFIVAPSRNAFGVVFSPDGRYMAMAHQQPTGGYPLTVFKRIGDEFSEIGNIPGTIGRGWDVDFTPDGQYLGLAHQTATRSASVYRREGDDFINLNLVDLDTYGRGISFSPDGIYMALALSNSDSSFARIYKKDDSAEPYYRFGHLADLPGTPDVSRSADFSPDGAHVAFAHRSPPYATIYRRNGDNFTKLPDITGIPGDGNGVEFSPDGNFMAVVHDVFPYVTVFKREGDVFTKLPNLSGVSGSGRGVAFSPDSKYMAVAHAALPYLTVYRIEGEKFNVLPEPSLLPLRDGNDVAFSPDGRFLAIVHDHYQGNNLSIYKANEPPTPPESGAEIFGAFIYNGNNSLRTLTASNMRRIDSAIWFSRNMNQSPRGLTRSWQVGESCVTNSNAASTVQSGGPHFNLNSLLFTNNAFNSTGEQGILLLCRARGFYDYIEYGTNGSPVPKSHDLGVVPELTIEKRRISPGGAWVVIYDDMRLTINTNSGGSANSGIVATETTFTPSENGSTAEGGRIAHLFATLPGISKVGEYIGNGGTQTIDCGFTTGARFVLIKRIGATGSWMVWNYAYGFIPGTGPYIELNTSSNPITGTDTATPLNSGFRVRQNSTSNANVSGGRYLFLAIA